MEAYDAGIVHQAPPATMAFWKENDMKRFGVLLASAALGAAVAASGPALAFGGGHDLAVRQPIQPPFPG